MELILTNRKDSRIHFRFFLFADSNQIRSPSWGFHSLPGFLPAHAPTESPAVNLPVPLTALQNNLPPQKPQVNLQNAGGGVQVLSHIYSDPRFPYPFRTSNATSGTPTTAATTANGLAPSMSSMGGCAPAHNMESSNAMLSNACQPLNPSSNHTAMNNSFMNNTAINNGVVNNGLTFRTQPFIPQPAMTAPKVNMQYNPTTATSMLGHALTPQYTTCSTFPIPKAMPLMNQSAGGIGSSNQRFPMASCMSSAGETVVLSSVGQYHSPSRNDIPGMMTIKQEPIAAGVGTLNHQGGMDVNSNGTADSPLSERNGTSTPKGVWRPY